MSLFSDIKQELAFVLKGKTFDALFPPIVFTVLNQFTTLFPALLSALFIAVGTLVYRVISSRAPQYALLGVGGVLIASAAAWLLGEASGYFLPGIISNGLIAMLLIVSIVIKMPGAMVLSHLTRGWPIEWFKRTDVYPAYKEVTIGWTLLFLLRLSALLIVYFAFDTTVLAVVNTVLGLPAIILVLVGTYIYGIKRLHRLGGPGVDEFINETPPPWKGQTRGF